MARKIIWTPQAKLDRFDIIEYLYKNGTPKTTLRKIDSDIKNIISHLLKFPSLGKPFGKHSERILFKSHYSVIYSMHEADILILQIWDTRRNPDDFI